MAEKGDVREVADAHFFERLIRFLDDEQLVIAAHAHAGFVEVKHAGVIACGEEPAGRGELSVEG